MVADKTQKIGAIIFQDIERRVIVQSEGEEGDQNCNQNRQGRQTLPLGNSLAWYRHRLVRHMLNSFAVGPIRSRAPIEGGRDSVGYGD